MSASLSAANIAARIDRMPFSRWHGRLLALVGSAHLFDAYDATAIAYVLPILVEIWHLSPIEAGLLISAGYLGQLCGAICGGLLAEARGRIMTLQLSLGVLALLSLACVFAPAYGVLVALRIAQGVGLGAEPPAAATYLNETCPARFRGRMVTVIAVVFASGAVAAAVLGTVLIPRFGWQAMFVVGTLPMLLAIPLRRLLPESPRWLAAKGRNGEAEAALARIERGVFGDRQPPPLSLAVFEATPEPVIAAAKPTIGTLLASGLRRDTMSAWLVAIATSIVAYGIIGWMPTIYRTIYHQPIQVSLRYGAITGIASIAGAIASLFIVDRIGRRATIALGFLGSTSAMSVLAIWGLTMPPVYVMLFASIAFMSLGLPLSAQYAYIPELYPTSVRALGVGIATSWMRFASIVSPPLIGLMLTIGSVRSVFLTLALAAGMGLAAILILGRETSTSLDRDHGPVRA